MPYKTATLDGKRIIYSDDTTFEVQVGHKNRAYATRYAFKGNLAQAVMH